MLKIRENNLEDEKEESSLESECEELLQTKPAVVSRKRSYFPPVVSTVLGRISFVTLGFMFKRIRVV